MPGSTCSSQRCLTTFLKTTPCLKRMFSRGWPRRASWQASRLQASGLTQARWSATREQSRNGRTLIRPVVLMDPKIFREYDIRGIADKELTSDVIERIGKAFGTKVRAAGKKDVILCRDNRLTSLKFRNAM